MDWFRRYIITCVNDSTVFLWLVFSSCTAYFSMFTFFAHSRPKRFEAAIVFLQLSQNSFERHVVLVFCLVRFFRHNTQRLRIFIITRKFHVRNFFPPYQINLLFVRFLRLQKKRSGKRCPLPLSPIQKTYRWMIKNDLLFLGKKVIAALR